MSKPTYNLAELKTIIPFADLEKIKSISLLLKEEHKHFTSKQMSDLLEMVARRLIDLSNGIKSYKETS